MRTLTTVTKALVGAAAAGAGAAATAAADGTITPGEWWAVAAATLVALAAVWGAPRNVEPEQETGDDAAAL